MALRILGLGKIEGRDGDRKERGKEGGREGRKEEKKRGKEGEINLGK